MDLIYTNNLMEDEGVLSAYELDLAFGSGENDFELRAGAQNILSPGNYIYIEGTEYGGIIDSIETDTSTQEIIYHGRTWHGILNSHIIEPPAGQAHRVASGGFHSNLEQILQSLQITDIFEVGDYDQDFNLQAYNIPRYIPAYSGIMKVVEDYNRYSTDQIKLFFIYDYGAVKLKAVPVADYSQAEGEINSDLVEFRIKKVGNKPNILIGLGQGELENRTVYHLYVKADGTITEDPTEALLGVERNVVVYENTAEADLEKFKAECYKRLKQLLNQDTIDITLNDSDDCFDIGDTIEATDTLTNTTVRATIKKKIVKIKDGFITVQYDTTDKLAAESRKTYSGGYSGETSQGGTKLPLEITSGGTGATTAEDARNNLGISTPIAVANGGTGATTTQSARQNLGIPTQADYITEQGTSGIWKYRKWSSGISECWGQYQHNITGWSAWGNAYEGTPSFRINYPSIFILPPTLSLFCSSSAMGVMSIENYGASNSARSAELFAIRPNAGSTGNIIVSIYAIGQWE